MAEDQSGGKTPSGSATGAGAAKPGSSKIKGVKGPLIFSAVLGLIAGVVTIFFATGGTGGTVSTGSARVIRFDLGAIAFGVTFIVCLVVCAMLLMTHKENPEELSAGSGVNLRSEDRLKKPQTTASADNAEGGKPAPSEVGTDQASEAGTDQAGGAAPEQSEPGN